MTSGQKRTCAFAAGFVALLLALTVVSRSTRPPRLPNDPAHAALPANAACKPCHGKGARAPLKPRHPPKDDCLHCHRAETR